MKQELIKKEQEKQEAIKQKDQEKQEAIKQKVEMERENEELKALLLEMRKK